MDAALKRLQKYLKDYEQESRVGTYSEKTFVLDVLYGLGVSIDHGQFCMADGFDRFKARIAEHMERPQ